MDSLTFINFSYQFKTVYEILQVLEGELSIAVVNPVISAGIIVITQREAIHSTIC